MMIIVGAGCCIIMTGAGCWIIIIGAGWAYIIIPALCANSFQKNSRTIRREHNRAN
jgi:hypothetical protein